jgi:hypothetical protein
MQEKLQHENGYTPALPEEKIANGGSAAGCLEVSDLNWSQSSASTITVMCTEVLHNCRGPTRTLGM